MTIGSDDGPPPDDVDGWRTAIAAGRLSLLRAESIVAAIQDIGPDGDDRARGQLMMHISDRITRILTGCVNRGKPNRKQIIERVQFTLVQAILQQDSSDGQGLRTAFRARVAFRATDAVRNEDKNAVREPSYDQNENLPREPKLDRVDWTAEQQQMYYGQLLQQAVPDPLKRLAFSLDVEGIPFESKKGPSIAKAVGVNEKTARDWVREVKEELKRILEDTDD